MTRDVCFPLTIGFLCLFCFCRLSFLCWNLHGGIIKYKPSKKSKQTIPNFSEIWMLGIVSHCPLAAVEQNHTLVCCMGFILPFGALLLVAQHQFPLQALATWWQRSGFTLGFTGSLALLHHDWVLCKPVQRFMRVCHQPREKWEILHSFIMRFLQEETPHYP